MKSELKNCSSRRHNCGILHTFCKFFSIKSKLIRILFIVKTNELNFALPKVRGSVDALLFCPKNEDSGTYARLAALPGAEKTYCFQAYKARLSSCRLNLGISISKVRVAAGRRKEGLK
jgi:hypothetical protein